MDDLISRQAAIELIENESRKWGDEYGVSDVLCDLADLPAAQPEKRTNKSTKTHACDCVSRQAAIDALIELYEYQRDIDPTEAADLVRQGIYLAEKKIEQLPSAQPEIIYCKDCEFTDGKGPIDDGRYWCVLHEGFMYFCSDAERRTDE